MNQGRKPPLQVQSCHFLGRKFYETNARTSKSHGAAGDGDLIGRDRNLLFGVFAVQMRLIEGEAFLDAAAAWSANPRLCTRYR